MNVRARISVFAVVLCAASTPAAHASGWMRFYGTTRSERASSIDRTTDGGIVMAASLGFQTTTPPWSGLWLAKLDSAGDLQWERKFTNLDDPTRVRQTQDGGYIVVGGSMKAPQNDYEAWVLKTDQSGVLRWQVRFDEARSDSFNDVRQTPDGGYLLVGVTDSNAFGYSGATPWVVRIDAAGNVLWQRTYRTESGTHAGNAAQPLSVVPALDGGYLLAGYARHFSCSEVYGCDGAWLARIDVDGALQWSKVLGYGDGSRLLLWDVEATSAGNYLAVGSHRREGSDDIWLVRVSGQGAVSHQAALGTEADREWARAITRTADDGFALGAASYRPETAEQQIWLLRLGAGSDVRWGARFGTHALPGEVLETADGGYVVAGWAQGGAGGQDAILARYEEPSGPGIVGCYTGRRTSVRRVTTQATERELGITEETPTFATRTPVGFEEAFEMTMTDFPCERRPRAEGVDRGILDDLERCVVPPSSPDGLPGRCPPLDCPECGYRLASADPWPRPLPEALSLYRLLERLGPAASGTPAPEIFKDVQARMTSVPVQPCQEAGRGGGGQPNDEPGPTTIAELRYQVGSCLNAIEVAALRPRRVSHRFEGVGRHTADLAGVAEVSFENKLPGVLELAVVDSPSRIPPPYQSVWPRIAYELKPAEGLAEIPIGIDLFVGGLGFARSSAALHILSWDGRAWHPLSTTVSPDGSHLRAQIRGATTLAVASAFETERRSPPSKPRDQD